MDDALRVGIGPFLLPVPGVIWRRLLTATARRLGAEVAQVSDRELRVRAAAVTEVARGGRAVSAQAIAAGLELPLDVVVADLGELDRRLIYLHRDANGAVEWAYPVTAARTPHRVRLGGAEPIGAA